VEGLAAGDKAMTHVPLTREERAELRNWAETSVAQRAVDVLRLIVDLEAMEAAVRSVRAWTIRPDEDWPRWCHFCDGDKPKHEDGCAWVRAKEMAG